MAQRRSSGGDRPILQPPVQLLGLILLTGLGLAAQEHSARRTYFL